MQLYVHIHAQMKQHLICIQELITTLAAHCIAYNYACQSIGVNLVKNVFHLCMYMYVAIQLQLYLSELTHAVAS